MNTRGRFGFGVLFAAVGIGAWTRLLWAYEPVGRGSAQFSSALGYEFGFSNWLTTGRDVRLSALVLGVGGLLITARGWRPGAWLALALGVVWGCADFALDVADVVGLAPVVAAGLTVATLATAIIVASVRRRATTGAGRAWWLLVYAGMAVGVATLGQSIDGSGPVVAHVVIFGAVLASALVAAAAVNPAGTPSTGRWLTVVLVVLAVAMVLPVYSGWWGSGSGPYSGSPSFWRQTAVIVAALLSLPLVGAAAIARTGVLSRRWPVALPVIVLALVPATSARSVPTLPWWPAFAGGDLFDAVDGKRHLPGQLISGLLVGVTVWVLARLAPELFRRTAQNVDPPALSASAPTKRWTTPVGLVLASAGVVGWAAAVALVAPAARAVDHGQPISIHITAPLIGWAANLRWGAILLAWGGLLLAARTRGRGRWLTAGVLVWFVVDLLVAVLGVRGWLAAAICAVVAGACLFLVALTGPTMQGVAPGLVGYAAAAAGAGIQLMAIKAFMPQYLPSWSFQLGLAVSLLLVGAAGVHTLTTGLAVRAGHNVGAVLVTAVGTAGAVLHYATGLAETNRSGDLWVQLTLLAAVVVAATVCGLSTGGALRRWWATAGALAVVVIGAFPLFIAAVRLAYLPQDIAFRLDGVPGLAGEWFNDTLAGAMVGVSVALVALLPKALSTPDSPLATEPPPPPPEPLNPPEPPAPLAVPGVPEILSWPANPDPVTAR